MVHSSPDTLKHHAHVYAAHTVAPLHAGSPGPDVAVADVELLQPESKLKVQSSAGPRSTPPAGDNAAEQAGALAAGTSAAGPSTAPVRNVQQIRCEPADVTAMKQKVTTAIPPGGIVLQRLILCNYI